jgi:dCMP deaminase
MTIEEEENYLKSYNMAVECARKAAIRFPTRYTINETSHENGSNSFLFRDIVQDSVAMYTDEFSIPPDFEYVRYDPDFPRRAKASATLGLVNLWSRLDKVLNVDKWNARFLNLAKTVSSYSKDPSTKVGAVIVDEDDNVRTIGYNGFPRGVNDTEERLNDRPVKYALTVHAELNAICTCARVGVPTKGATMVCTHFPCSVCAGAIVQAGFKEVVVLAPSEDFDSRWNETNNYARTIFTEGNVDVIVFTEDELNEQ